MSTTEPVTRADLEQFQKVLLERLDRTEAKLEEHDGHFERIEAKLEEHDGHFERIEAKLEEHDGHFANLALEVFRLKAERVNA